ncbi:epoxide hydrolase N-terminal domain-containing protein [Nocardia sp. NPDC050710]|uniref:epoxide hydrolase N-terminal domain-containing protein n=1 Tax=Nocardia sp. NPDC050710 TaxID=3157220 RepID=UPI00340CC0EA
MADIFSGEAKASDLERFSVHIGDRDLIDLRARLDRARLPKSETVLDATQGIELKRLVTLLDAWRAHDWREGAQLRLLRTGKVSAAIHAPGGVHAAGV